MSGDATAHVVPQYNVPIVQNGVNSSIWYRYFQNISDSDEFNICPVANLPNPKAGNTARGFVSDSTSATFYSTLTGGGSITVPVFFDGSVWRIG